MIDRRLRQTVGWLIDRAIAEDLGEAGDITSHALFSAADTARGAIVSKSAGVLSGAYLLRPIFSRIDDSITVAAILDDGARLEAGSEICRIAGPVRGILAGERIALNFLQRLSGIATLTAAYVKAVAHTRARVLDTRKTTPGLRLLEKAAVRHGGGSNHRTGLYDMVLIKGTHVRRCGGVSPALRKALAARGRAASPLIEIEVRTAAEFEEAAALRPDRIMLDNMSIREMQSCVEKRLASGSRVELEASGRITLKNIAAVAQTGVDFISCGALTHSAPALDIHLVLR